MLTATTITSGADATDTVTLDFDARHRRRIKLASDGGLEFLLDLEQATALADGDGLLLEDGRVVRVVAKAEPVMDVLAGNPLQLTRLAWHLGNRHTPTQILAGRLRIREDHVLAHMLEHQGATIMHLQAPFDPEGGAYHHHDH